MINAIPKYILIFFIAVLTQILILNNILFSELNINPFWYIIFILLLPVETPKWLLMILSFAIGIIIDIFSDTIGIHASASVFIGYIRPFVLHFLSPRDDYEAGTVPRQSVFGFTWFLKYTSILVFFHHLLFYFVEAFSFSLFFITFLKVIIGTLFTSVIILLSQYFIFKE